MKLVTIKKRGTPSWKRKIECCEVQRSASVLDDGVNEPSVRIRLEIGLLGVDSG